jgi:hypothetical protein
MLRSYSNNFPLFMIAKDLVPQSPKNALANNPST